MTSLTDDAGQGRRGPRPSLTTAIKTAVNRVWGIDLDQSRFLGGSTGLNIRAESKDGPVVVRIHRRHVNSLRVEAMQVAREAVHGGGVPTACTVLGSAGERTITVESLVVEVESYVDSDAKMDTIERIDRGLPSLARIHDVLRSTHLPDAANDLQFGNFISSSETVAGTAVGSSRMRAIDESLSPIADMAERLAWDIAALDVDSGSFAHQYCHGDYWDNNVLFRGDELALVADFGYMNRRPRIDDLSLTLYFTLLELDAIGNTDPIAVVARLVDAYDAGSREQLTQAERRRLPLAIARQSLWSISVWAALLDHPRAVRRHLSGHAKALVRCRQVIDDLSRWQDALAG